MEDYENETFLWNGLVGMVCDTINYVMFGGRNVFYVADMCLYVPAYVPEDREEAGRLPTREDIRRILCDYINGISEEPITVEWLAVSE